MDNKQKIKLDEESLEFILNFTLDNLKEDRRLALQHHTILSGLLNGAEGSQLSALEIQMMVQELSSALTNFLKSAATSTEQGLKMAKILSDLLSKIESEDSLSDYERANIEEMLGGFEAERENVNSIQNIIDMAEHNK